MYPQSGILPSLFPRTLSSGGTIRIIAPSCTLPSMPWLTDAMLKRGLQQLEQLGLRVTWGKHVHEKDVFDSTDIDARVEDLHDAFRDSEVKLVLAVRGGWNSNQLLRHIDYALIKKNPKILCGFSDITALANAIYARTGLVTYSGPNLSTFCRKGRDEYTLDYFKRCVMQEKPFDVRASERCSELGVSRKNDGHWIFRGGKAEGTIIGGNLCTLNLLLGTEFFPDIRNCILFIEEDEESATPHTFDRNLQSLLHQKGIETVRGLVIGRFQKKVGMKKEILRAIVESKRELPRDIPIIANVDFGHTLPMITFPIGGKTSMETRGSRVRLTIIEH